MRRSILAWSDYGRITSFPTCALVVKSVSARASASSRDEPASSGTSRPDAVATNHVGGDAQQLREAAVALSADVRCIVRVLRIPGATGRETGAVAQAGVTAERTARSRSLREPRGPAPGVEQAGVGPGRVRPQLPDPLQGFHGPSFASRYAAVPRPAHRSSVELAAERTSPRAAADDSID